VLDLREEEGPAIKSILISYVPSPEIHASGFSLNRKQGSNGRIRNELLWRWKRGDTTCGGNTTNTVWV